MYSASPAYCSRTRAALVHSQANLISRSKGSVSTGPLSIQQPPSSSRFQHAVRLLARTAQFSPVPCLDPSSNCNCNWKQLTDTEIEIITDPSMLGSNQVITLQTAGGQSSQVDVVVSVSAG